MIIRYFFLCLWMAPVLAVAQPFRVTWNGDGPLPENSKSKFASRPAATAYLQNAVSRFQSGGYWEASCDSIYQKDSHNLVAVFHAGPLYHFNEISTRQIPREILQEAGVRNMKGKDARLELLQRNVNRLLGWCENHGYPFATVMLDSAQITDEKINASWKLSKGKFYKIDSIIIKGPGKLPVTYIRNYIRVRPDDPYRENAIREIDQRLKEIPFITVIKPTEVVFTERQCQVFIYVKKKNASTFNGILGLLPDNKTGKLLVTGDARVSLRNALSWGEWLEANWRRLGNKTQDMKLTASVPYLFRTPLGTEGMLKIYKRDTSYIEVTRHAALTYNFSPRNQVKVIYNQYTSDVISLTGIVNASNVLRYSDIVTYQYGLGLTSRKTDHLFNPRRGYLLNLEGLAGHKTIRSNAGVNDSLYNNIKTRTENYTINLTADGFIPVFKQSAIHLGNQTRVLINPLIFQNESMRLGGIRTLRGFDEESIFTTAYSVFTAEYRFLFEENSFAYLFFNQAWYENNVNGSFSTDTPYGFGAGISFGVKTGIFTLNYALGSQFGNPIQLRGSKVHFGFISYF